MLKDIDRKGSKRNNPKDRENITDLCLSMSKDALRVLGFATRNPDHVPEDDDEDIEKDMTFIGVAGMIDPPRKKWPVSQVCRQAGIRTIMITGDHKDTAVAIAKELDIYRPETAS